MEAKIEEILADIYLELKRYNAFMVAIRSQHDKIFTFFIPSKF